MEQRKLKLSRSRFSQTAPFGNPISGRCPRSLRSVAKIGFQILNPQKSESSFLYLCNFSLSKCLQTNTSYHEWAVKAVIFYGTVIDSRCAVFPLRAELDPIAMVKKNLCKTIILNCVFAQSDKMKWHGKESKNNPRVIRNIIGEI